MQDYLKKKLENMLTSFQAILEKQTTLLWKLFKKQWSLYFLTLARFLKWGNQVTPHCGKKKLLVINPQSVKHALLVKATHPITWTGDNYGKTLAICQALDDLVESNVNLLVLSDSLSVLSALQNFSIKSNKVIHRLANKIYMLSNYVNHLILLWTPGHSKIVWNEQADNLARSVTESNVYIDWIASDDIHKNIYRNRIQKNQ
ncbi:RNase H domain-containing protein [Trichonephila clavipes]|nr:RNase H domain-containing protein [Trichonephila clavipes]